ncbi:hypothetical protein [Petroclostridium sp. X23]|uniref:hypothetical protein n=1 Tax=Petroclostridium sp. X23 TaxID=3045146 RepID=UPI0024AE03EC|nr:hypothetical protein [Petroclostridium sp. X23]WHH59137.1 hypothetical protein QKW49_25685 [Petroclostridium sp. X23]
MGLDIKFIKPKKKNISDKFSSNLYEFLKAKPYYDRVYWYEIDPIDGTRIQFSEECRFDISNIIIGMARDSDGVVSGRKLSSILMGVKGYKDAHCYHPIGGWDPRNFVDITDWFWDRYFKIGRCLFLDHDRTFIQDDNNTRWTYINKNSRRCNWCGEWQHRTIVKKVKIERREIWAAV